MKHLERFFQWLQHGLRGERRIIVIGAAIIILGVSQFVYLKLYIYPSSSNISKTLTRLGTPSSPATEKARKKLKKWGPAVIDDIAEFCSDVESPVLMQKSLQRASAVEILSSFYSNPRAISALIDLTRSEDGAVRKKTVYELRYQWGKGVTDALLATIHAEDVKLTVMDGTTPVMYTDFDITAVESLIAMNRMWMGKDLKVAETIQKVLEKALEYPRVKDKAKKALGR